MVGVSALFNPAITYMITSAYRKLGVINEDEAPTAGMFDDAMFAANSLVKEWMASGIHVWTEQEATLFLQKGQARYLIGGTTTTNTSDDNTWILGTLASTSVIGATTVTMVSATGVAITIPVQNIGIVQDNGTTLWATVTNVAGNVVTFTPALTGSASSGNYAFVYTTKIARPLKIPGCSLLRYNGLLETPMVEFSRQEYSNLPNKASLGTPSSFFYAPSLVSGELFVWPTPRDSSCALSFTWYRPILDFDDPATTADMPQEWLNALTWNLAIELAPDFSIPPTRYTLLKTMADEKLELVRGFDREAQPIIFQMDYEEWGW